MARHFGGGNQMRQSERARILLLVGVAFLNARVSLYLIGSDDGDDEDGRCREGA